MKEDKGFVIVIAKPKARLRFAPKGSVVPSKKGYKRKPRTLRGE
jgi:hypothetical protein